MDGNEAKEVMAREMRKQGKGMRRISKALGMGRKKLRRILGLSEASSPGAKKKSSKLDRFKERVRQLAELKEGPAGQERMLTVKGIFRALRKEGYDGGKTILGDMVREMRGASRTQAAFARYEPAAGLEAQSDWSPYRVLLGGRETKVHVFSMILSYSRYQYLEAFADEGQDALFQGHVEAFRYFRGIPAKILYDNQSPVAACRIGGKALLNPRFEAFARHNGFKPVVGEPYRKERRGRVERPFGQR